MTVNTKSITERAIEKAEEHKDLSYEEMHEFFTDVLNDKVTDHELQRFIVALSDKGETVDEITAIAEVLKSYAKDIPGVEDRRSTRLNSSHVSISYAVFCLKRKMDPT